MKLAVCPAGAEDFTFPYQSLGSSQLRLQLCGGQKPKRSGSLSPGACRESRAARHGGRAEDRTTWGQALEQKAGFSPPALRCPTAAPESGFISPKFELPCLSRSPGGGFRRVAPQSLLRRTPGAGPQPKGQSRASPVRREWG